MKKAQDIPSPTPHTAGGKALSISQILDSAHHLLTKKNIANGVHWAVIVSAAVVSVGTTVLPAINEKVVGYGIAVSLISAAQIIHKFADTLDHQQTLTQAVEATLPAIEAATTGNEHQLNALEKELHK